MQVRLKKWYSENIVKNYLLPLISESQTHILCRFITQTEIFQAFISCNVDESGLQMMTSQGSLSQTIRILN